MTNQIRKFYEQQRDAGAPQAMVADEVFQSLIRIATARGLRVRTDDRAEELVTSIFEFLLDSNTADPLPLRFRLQQADRMLARYIQKMFR